MPENSKFVLVFRKTKLADSFFANKVSTIDGCVCTVCVKASNFQRGLHPVLRIGFPVQFLIGMNFGLTEGI